jgi:glyoxylase-like metal-dependent hydrolase (beta-lactamase superfamily II)
MSKLQVLTFAGKEANVNAYILMNDSHAIIIDSLRNREEAAELAELVTSTGKIPYAILITHGHPDHYIGCRTLKERFPSIRILVASDEIKSDIVAFSKWMESVNWLDQQPQMKPMSPQNPDGFDYEGQIEVLNATTLSIPNGGDLQLVSDYPQTECGHMTTVSVPELGAFFAGDLCYNGVHAWAGPGVAREHIGNWETALTKLRAHFADSDVTVYPGHGNASKAGLFDDMGSYLENFVTAVDEEPTNAAAMDRMKRLYAGFAQEDFLLLHSVNFHGPDSR